MKTEVGYKGYFQFKDKAYWGNVHTELFDPASISKVFYILYLYRQYDKSALENIKVKLTISHLNKYYYGTTKLDYQLIGSEITLSELARFSLIDSCNVATGILADYLDREKVNEFIQKKLGLLNTSIYCESSKNISSISDMWKFSRQLIFAETNLEFIGLLEQEKRRAVVQKCLGTKFQVFSKGGTTFEGLRRDWGFLKKGNEYGSFLIFQTLNSEKHFTFFDKALAKVHLGKQHSYIQNLNLDFETKVFEICQDFQQKTV